MYFLHSRKPRARIGMVFEWVWARSAMTSVKSISDSSVVIDWSA